MEINTVNVKKVTKESDCEITEGQKMLLVFFSKYTAHVVFFDYSKFSYQLTSYDCKALNLTFISQTKLLKYTIV